MTFKRHDPRVLAAIGLGGAVGAPARYGVAELVDVGAGSFPWDTFWINISGSFLLGLFLALLLTRPHHNRLLRSFVATGCLGAYTTYSTFAVESVLLAKDGHTGVAAAYAATSLIAGLGAAWAGIVVGRARRLAVAH